MKYLYCAISTASWRVLTKSGSDTQLKSMWVGTARFRPSSTMTSKEGPEHLVLRLCKSRSLNKQRMNNGSSLNGILQAT